MDTDTLRFEDVRKRHAAMELILHDRIIGTEFFNLVCGELIGEGTSRYVFEYNLDKRYVVKIDCGNFSANNLEWQIWHEIQFVEKINKWFAPIGILTRCGRVMLQRKCQTIGVPYDKYPKKIPDFFTDLKYSNWGLLNGRMVCVDYASTKLLDFNHNFKMVDAKWWRE